MSNSLSSCFDIMSFSSRISVLKGPITRIFFSHFLGLKTSTWALNEQEKTDLKSCQKIFAKNVCLRSRWLYTDFDHMGRHSQ